MVQLAELLRQAMAHLGGLEEQPEVLPGDLVVKQQLLGDLVVKEQDVHPGDHVVKKREVHLADLVVKDQEVHLGDIVVKEQQARRQWREEAYS
ncbi:hypothetical protein MTO96_034087 [Rhipicephalus appendiculatus]